MAAMKTMLVSEFKAKCIALLKEVQRTREPMLITLRGKPLVTVQPADLHRRGKRLGGLKGQMTIRRDLVRIDTAGDWDMLR
jgi:prevent-host-death family protein